jgi:hypothetical protein
VHQDHILVVVVVLVVIVLQSLVNHLVVDYLLRDKHLSHLQLQSQQQLVQVELQQHLLPAFKVAIQFSVQSFLSVVAKQIHQVDQLVAVVVVLLVGLVVHMEMLLEQLVKVSRVEPMMLVEHTNQVAVVAQVLLESMEMLQAILMVAMVLLHP